MTASQLNAQHADIRRWQREAAAAEGTALAPWLLASAPSCFQAGQRYKDAAPTDGFHMQQHQTKHDINLKQPFNSNPAPASYSSAGEDAVPAGCFHMHQHQTPHDLNLKQAAPAPESSADQDAKALLLDNFAEAVGEIHSADRTMMQLQIDNLRHQVKAEREANQGLQLRADSLEATVSRLQSAADDSAHGVEGLEVLREKVQQLELMVVTSGAAAGAESAGLQAPRGPTEDLSQLFRVAETSQAGATTTQEVDGTAWGAMAAAGTLVDAAAVCCSPGTNAGGAVAAGSSRGASGGWKGSCVIFSVLAIAALLERH